MGVWSAVKSWGGGRRGRCCHGGGMKREGEGVGAIWEREEEGGFGYSVLEMACWWRG